MRPYAARGSFARPQVEQTLAHYGENKFDIPLPTFGDMYKEQITSPFFVFQMFCILVRGWLHSSDQRCMGFSSVFSSLQRRKMSFKASRFMIVGTRCC
jgi:hypothetical protein